MQHRADGCRAVSAPASAARGRLPDKYAISRQRANLTPQLAGQGWPKAEARNGSAWPPAGRFPPAACAFSPPAEGRVETTLPQTCGQAHSRPAALPRPRYPACRTGVADLPLPAGRRRQGIPRFRQNCFMGRDTQPCLPGPPGTKNRKVPLAPSCPCSPVFCGAASVRPALSAIPDRLGSGHGSGIFPCPPPRVRGCPPRWGRSRHRRPPQKSGRVRWPRQPSASLQSAPSCRRG